MKTMTCKQLGGACDLEFHAATFDAMAEQSRKHGMEMYQAGDEAHLKAMQEMQALMKTPNAMTEWMKEKEQLFESLPDKG